MSEHFIVPSRPGNRTRGDAGEGRECQVTESFDTLDHAHWREFLTQRVPDGVLLRRIGQWLNAGVLEAGDLSFPEAGTPQGGVIAPLLAHVYLHSVRDVWFVREVQPLRNGRSFRVRYADDFVRGFACEEDARRVRAVLPQRFGQYGRTRPPDKTRLVPFSRPSQEPGRHDSQGTSQPGCLHLLGFTHSWGRSRKGNWVVKRTTSQGRRSRALTRMAPWCRLHRHDPMPEQHRALGQKLRGHLAYFGITGHRLALQRFRDAVIRIWKQWLSRRHRRGFLSWDGRNRLLKRYSLPAALAVHSLCRRAREPAT